MKWLAIPFRSIVEYIQGSYREFRLVTWPSREAIIQYTILVTVSIIISVLILTVLDYGLQHTTNRYLIR